MPKEYEFMKSAKEKEMTDDEYKTIRGEYDQKAQTLSNRIKKLIFALLIIYAVSFIALYLSITFNGDISDVFGGYIWIAIEFLIVIFLYDPKEEEDKKTSYETDKKILLNSVKNKIKMSKIRLGLVIFFGILFLILNIVWWIIFGSIEPGTSVDDSLMIFTQALNLCV